jgi:hypothetical protein
MTGARTILQRMTAEILCLCDRRVDESDWKCYALKNMTTVFQ